MNNRFEPVVCRQARILLGVLAFLVLGTSTAAEPPPFYEPKEHYYKAQGAGIKVDWSLDKTEVAEDSELIATLTVKGATNPREIVRPDLRKLPAFNSAFQIEDVLGQPV